MVDFTYETDWYNIEFLGVPVWLYILFVVIMGIFFAWKTIQEKKREVEVKVSKLSDFVDGGGDTGPISKQATK